MFERIARNLVMGRNIKALNPASYMHLPDNNEVIIESKDGDNYF